MPLFAAVIGAIQGLIVVGLLYLLEAVVGAFVPGWSLPFSVWWGLVFCAPGLAMALAIKRLD